MRQARIETEVEHNRLRTVVLARHYGKTPDEIAEITGLPMQDIQTALADTDLADEIDGVNYATQAFYSKPYPKV